MRAGRLRERLAFERRADIDDGSGNTVGQFQEVFQRAARVQPLKGSEAVQGQRLAGIQPVVISVRCCSMVSQVTTAWRVRDVRSGEIYNLTSSANMDERGKYMDFLATSGGADG